MIMVVPKLAETTDVIVVDSWLVAEGDQVTEGQPLFTAETDKATVEVPSPVTGTVVRLLAAEGDEAQTGDEICELQP